MIFSLPGKYTGHGEDKEVTDNVNQITKCQRAHQLVEVTFFSSKVDDEAEVPNNSQSSGQCLRGQHYIASKLTLIWYLYTSFIKLPENIYQRPFLSQQISYLLLWVRLNLLIGFSSNIYDETHQSDPLCKESKHLYAGLHAFLQISGNKRHRCMKDKNDQTYSSHVQVLH